MGDRAMCEIKIEGGSVFIYTHWTGHSLPEDAKRAIKRASNRWDDFPYATRIIVDQLTIQGRDMETGFGLMLGSTAEDEYNYDKPSVVIDLINQNLEVFRDNKHTITNFSEL
jgi:hypothetical protein